jgi:hypothetical protein
MKFCCVCACGYTRINAVAVDTATRKCDKLLLHGVAECCMHVHTSVGMQQIVQLSQQRYCHNVLLSVVVALCASGTELLSSWSCALHSPSIVAAASRQWQWYLSLRP